MGWKCRWHPTHRQGQQNPVKAKETAKKTPPKDRKMGTYPS